MMTNTEKFLNRIRLYLRGQEKCISVKSYSTIMNYILTKTKPLKSHTSKDDNCIVITRYMNLLPQEHLKFKIRDTTNDLANTKIIFEIKDPVTEDEVGFYISYKDTDFKYNLSYLKEILEKK